MSNDVHLKAIVGVLAGGLGLLAIASSQDLVTGASAALPHAASSPETRTDPHGGRGVSTTAPAVPTCGDQPTLTADGIAWKCTFDAEFTGTSYDPNQWQPVTTAASGYLSGLTACFVNNPANISMAGGYLRLSALQTPTPFWCGGQSFGFETEYTSGELSSYGRFSQTYGRFEVRARVPTTAVPGLQSSLWLYPQSLASSGPEAGEIDIAEVYSKDPYIAVPTAHYAPNLDVDPYTATNVQTTYSCVINTGHWNDYILEWAPGTLKFIYNSQTCLVDHYQAASPATDGEPFDQPFFINLTQALGITPNAFSPGTTPLPATTDVQYVRVWQAKSIGHAERVLARS
jgi:beta-glucanase (GH16 family)